jgi:glutamine synthetase
VNNGHRGYLEDRRPNSLGDPYRIAGRILQTIETIPTSDYTESELELEEAVA